MNLRETMATLKKMGTAQNRKIYKRHGAGDNLFGVSFANFGVLKKKIKTDHALAEQLWETGNSDAQTLALMIADPNEFTATSADKWLDDISFSMLAGMLSVVIAKSKLAIGKMKKWTKSKKEIVRDCGYALLCALLKNDATQVDDATCIEFLSKIEKQIHSSPNYARLAMNNALIAIGVYKPSLQKKAIETSRKIGKVDVDHGETGCKTPDAESYILKSSKRGAKKRKVTAS